MSNKITLLIKISEQYKLECCCIDSENKEITIQLHNTNKQEYLLSSSLIDKNSSIEFGEDLFTNPQGFKFYNIELYGKEYSVISEVLFALIISEFKEQIEKEFIIENTIVQVPSNNYQLINRIQTSLESIGLDNITINPIGFEYKEQ